MMSGVHETSRTGSDPDERPDGRVARMRAGADRVAARAGDWLNERRSDRVPLDLAARFYERDRDAFASVLGAAIALRLFLLTVSVGLLLAGVVITFFGRDTAEWLLEAANVSGSVADEVAAASTRNSTRGFVILGLGLWLTATTSRSFTKVLAACSSAAWNLGGRRVRVTVRMVGAVLLLVVILMASSGLLNRVREATGVTVDAAVWVVSAAVVGVAWFLLSWALPRGTRDPGALLPGGAMVAVTSTALQMFMQFYLPSRIARSSEVMGSLGFSVAILGYMFLMGRLLAAGLILNAVVHERFGSITGWVFGLPGIRRVPARSQSLREFFDLPETGET